MQKPVITLKNLSTNERLSEETACFSAVMYVDGVKTAEVANRGCGGANEMHFVKGSKWDERSLNDAVKATYGTYEAFGTTLDYNLETIVLTEVEVAMLVKKLQRKFKSKIVVVEGANIMEYSYKGVKALTQQHYDSFKQRNPEKKVLNLLSEDDLVAVCRSIQ